MGRHKKKTLKKYTFDKFYLNIDIYKKSVVDFKIRFDLQQEGDMPINIAKIKKKVETLFKQEYQYLERSRHIFEVDMVDTITTKTTRCSLNGYFLIFDDYEDYVINHAQEIIKKIDLLFEKTDLKIIYPTVKNQYTKTY